MNINSNVVNIKLADKIDRFTTMYYEVLVRRLEP